MSSREEILASIRKHTQTRYEKPDIADMKRLTYPDKMEQFCAIPKELDGTEVAVIRGEIGVAENGAVWIPQTVKYKAIYFISEKLVILIDRNKIVDTMYDAYRKLDGQEYQFGTFISGPSKTGGFGHIDVTPLYYSKINLDLKQ